MTRLKIEIEHKSLIPASDWTLALCFISKSDGTEKLASVWVANGWVIYRTYSSSGDNWSKDQLSPPRPGERKRDFRLALFERPIPLASYGKGSPWRSQVVWGWSATLGTEMTARTPTEAAVGNFDNGRKPDPAAAAACLKKRLAVQRTLSGKKRLLHQRLMTASPNKHRLNYVQQPR